MIGYRQGSVLVAARKRMAQVFDWYPNITVSISSGKDSTVLYHLALAEAERRDRKIRAFFLDQEAEWQSSIDLIEAMMQHPLVIPAWYQTPIYMTNAASHKEYFLDAWHEGREWMRSKHPIAIHSAPGAPDRFYPFFQWVEKQIAEPTAVLVGLRSKESLTRFRSISKNPGRPGCLWSTKTKSPHALRFYPIYDWTFGDIWKFIADEKLPYNRYYDRMFAKYGSNMSSMRVSNLIHEKSFKALVDVQEFEPETYERLVKRLSGIHCAALYAKDSFVYSVAERPAAFSSWRAYRDYLLASTPTDKIERFQKRFAGQASDETTCRMQCKQILLNDWENNLPVSRPKAERLRSLWWDRL